MSETHGNARTRAGAGAGRAAAAGIFICGNRDVTGRRQLSLFARPEVVSLRQPFFDGPPEAEPGRTARLSGQIGDIWSLMRDGKKRTLRDISSATGHPPASISAQLRHLRKKRFGAWAVSKKHLGNGLYHYWLDVSQ